MITVTSDVVTLFKSLSDLTDGSVTKPLNLRPIPLSLFQLPLSLVKAPRHQDKAKNAKRLEALGQDD